MLMRGAEMQRCCLCTEGENEMERNATRKRETFESCVAMYPSGDDLELINITEAMQFGNWRKRII